ncbi:glycerophosphoryl diester phosphodiesterase [Schinkia azotoformans MEV2011]|uniref:Glycerophosphoryl diester phosphodiesterase n=1 Tax=Schinkia azotoformans MEV2011 TaxID=1348973 RepID=A0A072NG60_SCHAZ|nr:glycerophosphodiester phosphodiesterase family protein [Schinkia azotoformans]KEF35918.1 glycerophosphoryl diester phosphodiesterase [Schinkia azotoformans MEV2011]MEC1697524.1 glycerophosphodiester phosphodiesterase family protein [Schinkia azotoformans]MEC1723723.1 glycerophosphodiester phosphodiesterase family protein [Schinkia azotoformans]MEC1778565.1 glycerophosphodiester phosphodiesterase family protein [Schinkia azotoformans]MED4331070.1 glycerophosphodiester phosphodiesterase famil
MKKLKRNIKRFFIFLVILVGFIYLNNTSLFTRDSNKEPLLLAHRGMAQTFHMEGITGETCTAERIYEPEHPFLENTIASMEAAFEAEADIVEFDVQLTKDGEFAVFHDWALECRTDGKGKIRDHTMQELKQLDIGYGYTADNGETYPFRGKGAGLMPTLDEVMSHFPKQSFLIHIKSNDPNEGVHLSDYLTKFPDSRLKNLSVYGGDKPIASLKDKQPDMHVMSKAMLKSCLLPYIAVGWTGYVPAACENTQLHIPEKYAPYMWGFPNKFLNRMEEANTRVILVAGDGSWSEGFDKKQDLERLPKNYTGGIWTNRIDIIAPILKE